MIGASLALLALASHWFVTCRLLRWMAGPAPVAAAGEPVTAVKALAGLVPDLEENLESFYRQTYPGLRIAFTAESEREPALAVARKVAARHPETPTEFSYGDPAFGPSPKVANNTPAVRAAKTDWLWFTDDNLRVDPESLGRLMALTSRDRFGSASGILAARGGRGLWGAIEAATVNTYHGRAMGAALAFGKPAPQGKSILIRRSTLDRMGGYQALGSYLGCDPRTGEELTRLGLRTYLDRRPLIQHVGRFAWEPYRRRHLRWALILKYMGAPMFWTQPLWTLLGSEFLLAWGTGSPTWMAAHAALWFLGDTLLLGRMDPEGGPLRWIGWVFRQALIPLLWLQATVTRRVSWRGGILYRFQKGGRVVPDPAKVSR